MPAKTPLTSIECYTLSHIQDELASVQDALTVTETEETWDSIGKALSRFAALCNGNANNYPTELVAVLRASSRSIGSALNSERTRLSGTATEFITTAVTALGSSFEPLIPHYFPTLLTLCTRANKVFITRAKAAIAAFIEYTHAPMIIHYAAESIKDKSVTLRLAAAETLMLCMKTFNPPDLEKEARAREIEAVIRSTAVDASADVRKMGRKIFDAYKILLPGRLHSFTDPLTPRTRKYLDIKVTNAAAAAPKSQPPSRPTSQQSTRSTQSETRSMAASHSTHHSSSAASQRPTTHIRSTSTSQTTSHAAPPQRPLRAPPPEVIAHDNAPRRVAREEPRRLKVDMPPPDYVPVRTGSADSGPQRPMSATELHFPIHAPSERPMSGPQRVIRPDLAAATTSSTTNPVRTGPIRPVLFNFRQEADDGTGETKARIVGGARRVLREPEPAPAPVLTSNAEDKGKGPSRAIRPRVISTSRSTPAVPLQVAVQLKEDAARVKKLASSMGASSRSGATATSGVAPTRISRTTSAAAVVSQATASSRARAAEKVQEKEKEKKVKERTKEREERRAKERIHLEVRDKEKTRPKDVETKDEEKPRERTRTRTISKPPVPSAAGTRPASTVTMRDKTNRVHSRSEAAGARTARQNAEKATRKARLSPEVPDEQVAEKVSPAEVPLPETPKVVPVAVQEPSPPALICFDSYEEAAPVLAVAQPEQAEVPIPAPAVSVNTLDSDTTLPIKIPLPSSRSGSPSSETESHTPPQGQGEGLTASRPIIIDITEPHTPTPEHRPQRRVEVEQTPISALVASIQREFLSMHGGSPLPPMIEEEEESMMVVDDSERDGRVFGLGVEGGLQVGFQPVKPLFSRSS
ncbi:clasp N terminal-domain-containing protein [Fomes fomentarius]|nr:clasp N terminal-domain-containing protein [Fomes fomentarius]